MDPALLSQLDYFGIVGVPTVAERDALLAARPAATCVDTGVSYTVTLSPAGWTLR